MNRDKINLGTSSYQWRMTMDGANTHEYTTNTAPPPTTIYQAATIVDTNSRTIENVTVPRSTREEYRRRPSAVGSMGAYSADALHHLYEATIADIEKLSLEVKVYEKKLAVLNKLSIQKRAVDKSVYKLGWNMIHSSVLGMIANQSTTMLSTEAIIEAAQKRINKLNSNIRITRINTIFEF